MLLERAARGDQDDLRVGRRAVVVDAELARRQAALLERDALGVPERGHGVDAAAEQRLTAAKPIVTWRTARVVAAVVVEDRVEERRVGGQAGDADGAALEVARAADAGLGDERGERAADERADRDQVGAALARDREVVDVEHAEVDLPAGDELERVGSAGPACGSAGRCRAARSRPAPAM